MLSSSSARDVVVAEGLPRHLLHDLPNERGALAQVSLGT